MRKRDIRVEVRFTTVEYAAFMRNVKKSGLNRESYLRSLAANYIPRAVPPFDFYGMTKELHAIGNNIHQVTARANATGFFMVAELRENMKKLFDAIDRIEAGVLEPEKSNGNNEDLGS